MIADPDQSVAEGRDVLAAEATVGHEAGPAVGADHREVAARAGVVAKAEVAAQGGASADPVVEAAVAQKASKDHPVEAPLVRKAPKITKMHLQIGRTL